jgi:hypothetical protein
MPTLRVQNPQLSGANRLKRFPERLKVDFIHLVERKRRVR